MWRKSYACRRSLVSTEEVDATVYAVVVNAEEQYSIWDDERELPDGWRKVGKRGSREECLEYIDEVWTDMRPLSLRRRLAEAEERDAQRVEAEPDPLDTDDEPTLVERLSTGEHPVELTLPRDAETSAIAEDVERGFVFVKFTDTRGGTELRVRLDREASDLSGADFAGGTGVAEIVGTLQLDFVEVRCHARIDVATRLGTGKLEPIAP